MVILVQGELRTGESKMGRGGCRWLEGGEGRKKGIYTKKKKGWKLATRRCVRKHRVVGVGSEEEE
jgi:hypothetical protein